jgi:hypothetical protein
MEAVILLREAVIGGLRGDAALMALVNAVEDGATPKFSAPALIVGEMFATEWGARGLKGLSIRVPLTLIDRADRPARLADAAERVEAVMGGLPATAGPWRIGVVRFDRSRTVRSADGQWSMLIDYLARLSRVG